MRTAVSFVLLEAKSMESARITARSANPLQILKKMKKDLSTVIILMSARTTSVLPRELVCKLQLIIPLATRILIHLLHFPQTCLLRQQWDINLLP
jgi:hypothetical protein